MKTINRSEVAAALVVGAIGLFVLWFGAGYSFGTARRMGPGFLPVIVGVLLTLLSAGLVVEVLRAAPASQGTGFRPFVMVMLAITAFAVLVERAGMVPATICLVVLAMLAERPFRPLLTVLLAAGISAMGVLIFIYALGIPLSAFRW